MAIYNINLLHWGGESKKNHVILFEWKYFYDFMQLFNFKKNIFH